MGRVRLLVVVAVAAVALVAGCAQSVPGSPITPRESTPTRETVAASAPNAESAPTTPPPGSPSDGPLVPDVMADECLLNASEFTALLGLSVQPAQATAAPNESIKVPSCVATTTAGPATPAGVVNVYGIRGGTPAEYVRGRAGRELAGVGEAARVVGTATATVLQAARGPFLITISALGAPPSDDAWRAAGNAALARLPG